MVPPGSEPGSQPGSGGPWQQPWQLLRGETATADFQQPVPSMKSLQVPLTPCSHIIPYQSAVHKYGMFKLFSAFAEHVFDLTKPGCPQRTPPTHLTFSFLFRTPPIPDGFSSSKCSAEKPMTLRLRFRLRKRRCEGVHPSMPTPSFGCRKAQPATNHSCLSCWRVWGRGLSCHLQLLFKTTIHEY